MIWPVPKTKLPTPKTVFASSDSISYRWLSDLHHRPPLGAEAAEAVALLGRLVPGRDLAPEAQRILSSADTIYIVERADERRFAPRNPLGGYDALLRAAGGKGRIAVLLVNGTCAGWRLLLDRAGWGILQGDAALPDPPGRDAAGESAAGSRYVCEDDDTSADDAGARGRRAAVFGAFADRLVCHEAAFPPGTALLDLPASLLPVGPEGGYGGLEEMTRWAERAGAGRAAC